jgi:hypothetical protein
VWRAERVYRGAGRQHGTAAALPATRSMSFMRSQKQTAASLGRFKRMAGLTAQMIDQSNPSSFNERCTAGRAFIRSK